MPILHGLGALYGLFDLERGGNGFMTGFAFPEILIKMRNRFLPIVRLHNWTLIILLTVVIY